MQSCFTFIGESGLRGTIRPIRLQLKENDRSQVIILPTQTVHCYKRTSSKMCIVWCSQNGSHVMTLVNNDGKTPWASYNHEGIPTWNGEAFLCEKKGKKLVKSRDLSMTSITEDEVLKSTCLTFLHQSPIISEPHKLKNKQGTPAGPMQFPILCLSASATKPTRAKYGGLLTCSPWSVTCLDGVTSWLNLNLRRHFLWPKLDEVYLQTCFFSVVLLFFLKIFIPMFESFSGN